ncbi:hypothetical protein V6N11_052131 [Hibiscus sabdariffa]|uniref:Uncharacterized protein n=1 Tax=Hibiscus sabdariffa TaxID=183260 RepID=A0ABR2U9N1_9ROSI
MTGRSGGTQVVHTATAARFEHQLLRFSNDKGVMGAWLTRTETRSTLVAVVRATNGRSSIDDAKKKGIMAKKLTSGNHNGELVVGLCLRVGEEVVGGGGVKHDRSEGGRSSSEMEG